MVQKIMLLGILLITAYTDWKERKVYLNVLAVGGLAGMMCCFFWQNPDLTERLGGIMIGLAVLGAAWVGKGCIGSGDGLVFVVSGVFLGFWENIRLLLFSLLLAGGAAIFLICIKKSERNQRMPFVPFLLAAYLLMIA